MSKYQGSEDTVYDYFTEEKWTFLIGGYLQYNKKQSAYMPYIIYRGGILVFQLYLICMAVIAAVVSYGDNIATIEAIHFALLVTVSFLGLFCRLSNRKLLKQSMQILKSGVYKYEDEEQDEQHRRIKEKYVSEIRNMNKMFRRVMLFTAATNTIMVPVVQYLMIKEDTSGRILNPYFPHPIYMPFNTRTVLGYIGGFILNVMFMTWFVTIVIGMDSVYISLTLQLKAQYEILNYSLNSLEKRAYLNLTKLKSSSNGVANEDLYYNKEFQKCLYGCLRSDIQHHQALVRLKHTFSRYIGLIFLIVVALASFILAAHVLLILEKPEIHILANFVVTLLCEMLYTLHYCWYGEELITESGKVYYSLYSTPWYNCDSRFKKLLSIMISNTRKPVENKTAGFDISASLNTFGSIISTMYQIMNVVRNSKS